MKMLYSFSKKVYGVTAKKGRGGIKSLLFKEFLAFNFMNNRRFKPAIHANDTPIPRQDCEANKRQDEAVDQVYSVGPKFNAKYCFI